MLVPSSTPSCATNAHGKPLDRQDSHSVPLADDLPVRAHEHGQAIIATVHRDLESRAALVFGLPTSTTRQTGRTPHSGFLPEGPSRETTGALFETWPDGMGVSGGWREDLDGGDAAPRDGGAAVPDGGRRPDRGMPPLGGVRSGRPARRPRPAPK